MARPGLTPPLAREHGLRARAYKLATRVATVGVRPGDPEALRVKKATVTLAVITVTLLAILWVATYAALGLFVSAAIPFSYQVISLVALAWFARTGALAPFRFVQVLLMMLLPFLLQWSLGGFAASSVVSLWAVVAVLGSFLFYGARGAWPWFAAFVALTVASGFLDASLAAAPADMPDPIRTAFFVLNALGVSVTAYALVLYFVRERESELERSDGLLLNILPGAIAERLKRDGSVIADAHPDVTVLFADVVNFTPFAARTPPDRVVGILDEIFTAFDVLAERHGLEKIKTIGDAYMAVAGLPIPRPDHARAAATMSLEMLAELRRVAAALGVDLELRIGLASGPVVAGVIGRRKFIYDLWGDTVNLASRMESAGVPGRVHVTEETRSRLADDFAFEPRGPIEIKGRGPMPTFLLVGPVPAPGVRPS